MAVELSSTWQIGDRLTKSWSAQQQGDAAHGATSRPQVDASGGAKAAPKPRSQPAASDIIIVLSDTDSEEPADPPLGPAQPPHRRPSRDGDATSPPGASGGSEPGAAQNGVRKSFRAADSKGTAAVAHHPSRAAASAGAADPLLKVFRQVCLCWLDSSRCLPCRPSRECSPNR